MKTTKANLNNLNKEIKEVRINLFPRVTFSFVIENGKAFFAAQNPDLIKPELYDFSAISNKDKEKFSFAFAELSELKNVEENLSKLFWIFHTIDINDNYELKTVY